MPPRRLRRHVLTRSQLGLRGLDDLLGGEAELLEQVLERGRGAERAHADALARRCRRTAPSRRSRPARPRPGP